MQRRVATTTVSGVVFVRAQNGGFVRIGANEVCEQFLCVEAGDIHTGVAVILREDGSRTTLVIPFNTTKAREEFGDALVAAMTTRQ